MTESHGEVTAEQERRALVLYMRKMSRRCLGVMSHPEARRAARSLAESVKAGMHLADSSKMIDAPKIERPLSVAERAIFDAYNAAAEAGKPKPPIADLCALVGMGDGGSIPDLTRRLEDMGLIRCERGQRSSRITIVETGKVTALPMTSSADAMIHWRDRPKKVPAPAPIAIRTRSTDIAAEIFTEAARLGKPAVEYLADLVFVGWEVEKSRG